jgi:hypothetical protein
MFLSTLISGLGMMGMMDVVLLFTENNCWGNFLHLSLRTLPCSLHHPWRWAIQEFRKSDTQVQLLFDGFD